MEEKCIKCHASVRPTDYFCYNCGTNLKSAPPSVSTAEQIMLYFKSTLLPPFGILWAIKYLKQDSLKSKTVGAIAIILTLASLIIGFVLFKNFMNNINKQVNEQLNSLSF